MKYNKYKEPTKFKRKKLLSCLKTVANDLLAALPLSYHSRTYHIIVEDGGVYSEGGHTMASVSEC